MRSTSFITAFVSLLTIASASRPAKQFKRDDYTHQDINPTDVCGNNYVNCNNGWCCPSGETCSNNYEGVDGIPTCLEGDNKEDAAAPYNFAAASSLRQVASTKLPAAEATDVMTAINNAAAKEEHSSSASPKTFNVPSNIEVFVIWASAAAAGFGLVMGRM